MYFKPPSDQELWKKPRALPQSLKESFVLNWCFMNTTLANPGRKADCVLAKMKLIN